MNRILLTAIIIASLVLPSAALGYSGGSGGSNDPYQIATKADFLELAGTPEDYNGCFILTADINLAGEVFIMAPIAPDTNTALHFQGTAFTGVFDGNYRKITNLTIDGGTNDYIGLFGKTDDGSVLKNLGLENFDVNALADSRYAGSLVGWNSGSITNCWSTGSVSGCILASGLVGVNDGLYGNGIITDCWSAGTVNGRGAGGLVGCNFQYAVMSNCYSTADVNGNEDVGGLIGYNEYGIVERCFSTGAINGTSRVGGLIGYNKNHSDAVITDCYSTGAVTGGDAVGGLVGFNYSNGDIANCYSTGNVIADSNVGALAGTNEGSITSSYFLSGSGPDNGFGQMLTDTQMKQRASFVDWDFIEIWNIGENQTYPFLRTYLPSDINKDGETNFYDLAILASHWLQQEGEN